MGAFTKGLIDCVTDARREHRGGLQVLEEYLQELCFRSSDVWSYARAELLVDQFAGLPRREHPHAHAFW